MNKQIQVAGQNREKENKDSRSVLLQVRSWAGNRSRSYPGYPPLLQEFQKVVGEQRKSQMLLKQAMTSLKSVYSKEADAVRMFRVSTEAGKPVSSRLLSCRSAQSPSRGMQRSPSSRPGRQFSGTLHPTILMPTGRTSSNSQEAMALRPRFQLIEGYKHGSMDQIDFSGAWYVAAADRRRKSNGS